MIGVREKPQSSGPKRMTNWKNSEESSLESTHAVRYYISGRKIPSISLGQVLDSVGDCLDGLRFLQPNSFASRKPSSPSKLHYLGRVPSLISRCSLLPIRWAEDRLGAEISTGLAELIREIDYNTNLSGSFKSSSLYGLRDDRENKKLEVVQSVSDHGIHQYPYIDRPNHRLYVTSWKVPPHLSAWSIQVDHPGGVHPRLSLMSLINQAPISWFIVRLLLLLDPTLAAVSSYIPSKHGLLFSVGGPTGEIHQLNQDTGAIEEKLQELLFVVPAEALHNEDKSRKALSVDRETEAMLSRSLPWTVKNRRTFF
ncbi:hypothetical protein, variant [Puccinia striiformis f. sp. tritici PST-78]|uniref:Uncharacterized protein n=1 Tax=Puccinia striiformis f. sp. tritici PST-78 TaxID=1165861 RepID=A0A0L0UZ07_9BASI|nr:hypothetical protein, variant [Puccinia striiformis f. sp. tritici PST-78]